MRRKGIQAWGVVILIILISVFTAGMAVAEVVLSDDFSSGLTNWNVGTNTNQNPSDPPDITVVDGRCVFHQDYDYIETKIDLTNDFEISFDIFNPLNRSPGNGAFWIQLLAVPDLGGIFRFRYGLDNRESINIVKPPTPTITLSEIGGIDDGAYLQNIYDGASPRQGSLTLYCSDSKIKVAYMDDEGHHIETGWASIDTFTSTKIRIWALKKFEIDNVIIKAPTAVNPNDKPKVVVIPLF